ncbi:MAG TPA: DEAD/DEAH box helicase, partial [Acidimicrobiales bacterium]|nr:DEAD/DEAH box helicase [Acidimicrobiales bacterium]
MTLDPFQRRACAAIDCGVSVLVVAPTGSGKTLVAEHGVRRALGLGRRAAYTAPTKALAGQKRRDLAALFGEERVGLITGDRVVRPDADVVVMTTEVLRAALAVGGEMSASLGTVVLDELHYIQDPERGSAWEEVILHAPEEVMLVCLSATIASADVLADWIRTVHGNLDLIEETERPVALQHLYAVGDPGGAPPLLLPMIVEGEPNPTIELLDGVRRKERGEGLRKRQKPVCTPTRCDMIEELRRRSMLPVIWFVLSRAGCDAAAADLVAQGVRLTTPHQAEELRRRAADIERGLAPAEVSAIGLRAWADALNRGVGTHHSGLLPEQREVVESAFSAGLLHVLFATETLALGVNLPARTVVIDRVVRSRSGMDTLFTSTQFAQLSGRAGRRGHDEAGLVVVPWTRELPFGRVVSLLEGRLPPLTSQLRPSGAMIANLAAIGGRAPAASLLSRSLRQHLVAREVSALRHDAEARAADAHRAAMLGTCACRPADRHTDDTVPEQPAVAIATAISLLRVGDVVMDGARPQRPAVVVLGAPYRTRGGLAVDAVGPDGRRTVLSPATCKAVPVVATNIALPAGPAIERGRTRIIARLVNEVQADAAVAKARRLVENTGTTRPSDERPHRAHERAATKAMEHLAAATRLGREADDLEGDLLAEASAVASLLNRLGFLAGWEPTPRSAALRRLFHPAGLLVAVALDEGILRGTTPQEIGVLAACCLGRHDRSGTPAPVPAAAERYAALVRVSQRLSQLEHDAGVRPSPLPDPALA